MKASKILSLVLIPSALGLSFGICSTMTQKEDIRAAEQKALEIINTSQNMEFLLEAQKALEIRKYDLHNVNRDQVPIEKYNAKFRRNQSSTGPSCCKCLKCHDK